MFAVPSETLFALDPVRLTPPAADLVAVSEMRSHCRIAADDTQHDADLAAYIAAATSYLDGLAGILGRCLITQGWRCSFGGFPTGRLVGIRPGPVQAVTGLSYRQASDGAWTLLSGVDQWELAKTSTSAVLIRPDGEDWPEIATGYAEAVRVEFTAGFGDASADVPASIVQAAKLMVGHWFENREAVLVGAVQASELPMAVKALLTPYHHGGL